MDPFSRPRDIPPPQSITFAPPNQPPPDGSHFLMDTHQDTEKSEGNIAFMKGPKRKRLAKACDACHKSKRRCDGTAPCSNCYFASKKCTYTDASGKPVPAPRPFKPDRPESSTDARLAHLPPYPDEGSSNSPSFNGILIQGGDIVASQADSDDDRGSNPRTKRFKNDLVNMSTPSETPPRSFAPPLAASDRSLERDQALTRELVHLFFAYRQPQRMIIHQPTFLAALSHGTIPQYLLLAVCAVAAPLSKQPRLKTSPCRYAGEVFAREAFSLMFDNNKHLVCEQNLATAQALVLLQLYDRMGKSLWNGSYHQYALTIVEKLGIFDSDSTVLTPHPSPEFIDACIERECARRVFWLVFVSDCMGSVLYGRPLLATESQRSLRLPIDETSFELSPHTAIPEYMTKPSSSHGMCSEIGQLIRILSMHEQVDRAMHDFNNRENGRHPVHLLLDLESRVAAWADALPEHLRFTDDNLSVYATQYDTASNMGAWSFCAMHVTHSSCVFAFNSARQRCRTGMPNGPTWAHERVHKIIGALSSKSKLSTLLGIAIWPLFKYVDAPPNQTLLGWSSEFEEIWGVRIQDLCAQQRDYRQQSSSQLASPHPTAARIHPSVISPGHTPPVPRAGPDVNSLAVQPPNYTPQARTSLDPRTHSQPPPPYRTRRSREKDTRKTTSDSNIDPALQVVSNPRMHSTPQLPPPSLPSLKASGLLEWPHPGSAPGSAPSAVQAPVAASGPPPATNWQPPTQHLPSRQTLREPVRSPNIQPPPPQQHDMSRPYAPSVPSGMPVGLQWLAHESSVSRQS
ncbi:fungal-specific transcription factor domain-containing protein [Melanogaster broomeanus]|nr:fungal-specific transcription factor domain-containing protein [Melanogaster broomeanus]